MATKLAENIRRYRKDRSLTQEQLAEVLGVTAGAVYKWEAKLSIPDLDLIVEMADFFDTSVDVLLGYEMKNNQRKETVHRLREYRRKKDPEGLSEAEKALKKYPHSFEIVNESVSMYYGFGIETGNREYLRHAKELLEQALVLLPQNEDPEISEQTLYGKAANLCLSLGEWEEAVELWKRHNAGGLYDHQIGQVLASYDRTEEAVPFLSEAMVKILSELTHTVSGYLNVYAAHKDYASMQAILRWSTDLFSGLRKEGKPNFFDKVSSAFLAALAYAQWEAGQKDEARATLERTRDLAAFFDAAPSYDESDLRFITRVEGASAHDDIGATAKDAAGSIVKGCEDDAFTALWESVIQ